MESLIFVDSNIRCYYFDRSAQEHNVVSKKLEHVLDDGVAINTVVAIEVAPKWGLRIINQNQIESRTNKRKPID